MFSCTYFKLDKNFIVVSFDCVQTIFKIFMPRAKYILKSDSLMQIKDVLIYQLSYIGLHNLFKCMKLFKLFALPMPHGGIGNAKAHTNAHTNHILYLCSQKFWWCK